MMLKRSKKPEESPVPVVDRSPPGGSPSATPGSSLIAGGMVLDGECRTDGPLRVEGHVTGNVHASRLSVGPGGRVDGDVDGQGSAVEHVIMIEGRVGGAVRAARVEIGREGAVGGGMDVMEAVVRGRVTGTIVAEERLRLEETAVVEGDVTARVLGLKEGGQVFGTIRIGQPRSGQPRSGEAEATESRSAEARPGGARPMESGTGEGRATGPRSGEAAPGGPKTGESPAAEQAGSKRQSTSR